MPPELPTMNTFPAEPSGSKLHNSDCKIDSSKSFFHTKELKQKGALGEDDEKSKPPPVVLSDESQFSSESEKDCVKNNTGTSNSGKSKGSESDHKKIDEADRDTKAPNKDKSNTNRIFEIEGGGTYTDYSKATLRSDPVETIFSATASRDPTFPVKLHQILSTREFEDIISWLPHGRSFRVLQPKAFEERVIPLFFRHGRYASFARQVNGWGFHRVCNGPDYGAYYHELFLRGLPQLCEKMRRPPGGHKKKTRKEISSEPSPNFYEISEKAPLPELPPRNPSKTAASAENVNSGGCLSMAAPNLGGGTCMPHQGPFGIGGGMPTSTGNMQQMGITPQQAALFEYMQQQQQQQNSQAATAAMYGYSLGNPSMLPGNPLSFQQAAVLSSEVGSTSSPLPGIGQGQGQAYPQMNQQQITQDYNAVIASLNNKLGQNGGIGGFSV